MAELSRRSRLRNAPVSIEVRDVEKTFRIPDRKVDTLKERVVHPLHKIEYRELHALRGISFDVHEGEFFGIVGRNGSGKSTLLKVLASIYRADHGTVRMAGRLAPFIELGVGINPALTARENVALNGVMMGLGRREAMRRLDAVLEFAELQEFVDLKLKNYSSGMMVRLAFAVMVQADADVMLVDEVLAVGDAAFGQKCMDVFREKRDAGKTIVLVTHDMATVQAFCDRAMLMHDGEQRVLGEPDEAALGYFRLNFAGHHAGPAEDAQPTSVPDINVKLVDTWLEDQNGLRVENIEQETTFRFNLLVQARQPLTDAVFNFHCLNMDGHWVFAFSKAVEDEHGQPRAVAAGERVRIVAEIENPLVPGRYALECWMSRSHDQGSVAVHIMRLLDFVVFGTRPGGGSVLMTGEVDAVVEPAVRA
ncbi:MAG TPA: ABC transporter ATP-binding protein [Solirubrobacteraceae bacterium]|nr:ABC transporter ATP-binding protein [Solirubrobacteraceae bacterium]